MADPLGGIVDMAREIGREAKNLRQGLLLRRSGEATHIIELAGKIERAARIEAEDVKVLEKVIDETHDAIDQLEPAIGKAPAASPRIRIEWIKKQIDELKQVIGVSIRERIQIQEAINGLADQLGWRASGQTPAERIHSITSQVREARRSKKA